MDKFIVLLVIVSLLISLSFLGGVDLLLRQFCSLPATGGFCGVLHGISGMIGHLSFIQTLLVFLPALLTAFILSFRLLPGHGRILQDCRLALLPTGNAPRIHLGERCWLSYRTNSPNIR